MIPNLVNHVHPVHRFFLCGIAALREDHNPANLVHRVNNSGLCDYDDLGPSVRKIDAVAGTT